jgi:hypothetical protein
VAARISQAWGQLHPATKDGCKGAGIGLVLVILGAAFLGLERQLRWPRAVPISLMATGGAAILFGALWCGNRRHYEAVVLEPYEEPLAPLRVPAGMTHDAYMLQLLKRNADGYSKRIPNTSDQDPQRQSAIREVLEEILRIWPSTTTQVDAQVATFVGHLIQMLPDTLIADTYSAAKSALSIYGPDDGMGHVLDLPKRRQQCLQTILIAMHQSAQREEWARERRVDVGASLPDRQVAAQIARMPDPADPDGPIRIPTTL